MIHTYRHRVWFVLKTTLAVAVVAGLAHHFARILGRSELGTVGFSIRFEYLLPAGVLYLVAHGFWGSFWVRLLHGQGVSVSWYVGLRAYFVSQFGKYIPGKAWVILMRVGILRHQAHAASLPVAVTATYETLTSMAAGAFLGVLLVPYLGVLPSNLSGHTLAFVAVAALPVGLGLLNKLASWLWARRGAPGARPLPAPSLFLLVQGLAHGACGHAMLGLSLGLVIRGLTPGPLPAGGGIRADLGATAISYVTGFVFILTPGGLGVREGALQWLLAPRYRATLGPEAAAGFAVVVALVLRLVWTAAEVVAAGVLYLLPVRPRETTSCGVEEPPRAPQPQPVNHSG